MEKLYAKFYFWYMRNTSFQIRMKLKVVTGSFKDGKMYVHFLGKTFEEKQLYKYKF